MGSEMCIRDSLNTGDHLWWMPIGDTPRNVLNHPALDGKDDPRTGSGRQAAMFATPDMLVYASHDSDRTPHIFAVDKASGEELARVEIPSDNRYQMMTYMHEGKQYIVISTNGGNFAMTLPSS